MNGKIKNINWTKNAELVNKLDWNDDKLGSYFIEKILNYGPSVGFINFAQKKSSQKKKDVGMKWWTWWSTRVSVVHVH